MKAEKHIPNVVDFAHDIIDMNSEINRLRKENKVLREIVDDYSQHINNQNKSTQKMLGEFVVESLKVVSEQRK